MHTKQRPSLSQLAKLLLAVTLVVGTPFVATPSAGAHTPHDAISDVVLSPNFATDGKVYVISSSRLLVSDQGRWVPLQRGLPRAPEEGQGIARLAIAASAPDTMYVTSRIGGVFRSVDGGASWQHAAEGLARPDMSAIAVSPRDPKVVLAGGTITGFFRSDDGARKWKPIPNFDRVPALAFATSGRAFAGTGDGRLVVSDDDGATWKVAARAPTPGGVTAIAVSPDDRTVLAGTTRGELLRSDDGGSSFTELTANLPNDTIASLALAPGGAPDGTVWASLAEQGVFRSSDGGHSWERTGDGLTTDPQAQQVNVSLFRRISVAADAQGKIVLYVGGFDGLFRSDDDGASWASVETLADYIVGLAVSPDYEHDRTVAVAAYVKGAFLSSDDGAHWRPIDKGLDQKLAEGNEFAPVRRLHNITFSPDYAQDRTLFSAGWTAFLRSTDGGDTWTAVRVDPESPRAELEQFVLGISPAYRTDHTLFLGTRRGDIYRSADAGAEGSWTLVANVGARVRSFAFDPAFPATPVVFAGTVKGVRKSGDGGRTWRAVTTGPPGETLLARSPDFATDHTMFAGTERGLYVSRDAGDSWKRVDAPAFPNAATIEAVALSPEYARDHMMLVSVSGTGLFRSTDGGTTFTPVGSNLLATNHVISDFTNPTGTPLQFSPAFARDRTVFAYAQQDVLRSTDGGETWTVLSLPPALDFLRQYDPSGVVRYEPATDNGSSTSVVTVVLIVVGAAAVVALVVFLLARRRRPTRVAPS